MRFLLKLCATLFIGLFMIAAMPPPPPRAPQHPTPEADAFSTKATPVVALSTGVGLSIKSAQLSKDAYGRVVADRISIENWSSQERKDIVLDCAQLGQSGTEIGRLYKGIYEVFPAKSVKKLKNVPLGYVSEQVVKVTCEISTSR